MSQAQSNFDNSRSLLQGTSSLQSKSISLPASAPSATQGGSQSMSFSPSSAPPPPPSGQASVAAASAPPSAVAAPPPDAPIPDLSATTPMSSVATPSIPDASATAASAPAAPSGSPQEPGSPGILSRLRKHMKGFLLLLFFIGVATLLFFLVFRGGGGGGGGGGSGGSPAAKDLVIRIDKGSQLELQGTTGGSNDCSALKDSLDAISKKQDQLLKLVKDSDEGGAGVGAKNEMSFTRSEPPPLSKASAGAAGGGVHYSNELSTQAFSPPSPSSPQPGTSKTAPWVRSQEDVQAYGGGGALQPFSPLTPAWELDR